MDDAGRVNLRPYGLQFTPALRAGLWFGDLPGDVVRSRALARLRGPDCVPVGPALRASVVRTALALLLVAGTLIAMSYGPRAAMLLPLTGGFAFAFLVYSARVLVTSRPSTPARAVAEYLRCVSDREWARAFQLLDACERDGQFRCPPASQMEELATDRAVAFQTPDGLGTYWKRTLRLHGGAIVRLQTVRAQGTKEVAPGLCHVPVRIHVVKSVRLSNNKGHLFYKLAVRRGSEWRVFSGELYAPEEADLSWLPPPVE